jgi:hypothetical protein
MKQFDEARSILISITGAQRTKHLKQLHKEGLGGVAAKECRLTRTSKALMKLACT